VAPPQEARCENTCLPTNLAGMSGNPQDCGSSPDPISSKPLTWSPTPVRPAQIGQWAVDSNIPQASWGLEGDSDSEMETQPQTTPKARPPPPPTQVQTASHTLTNPLDCSQASSPTPVPKSKTASRIGKMNRPPRSLSTNLAAAGGAAMAALFPDRISSPTEYLAAARAAAQQQQHPAKPNHIISDG